MHFYIVILFRDHMSFNLWFIFALIYLQCFPFGKKQAHPRKPIGALNSFCIYLCSFQEQTEVHKAIIIKIKRSN